MKARGKRNDRGGGRGIVAIGATKAVAMGQGQAGLSLN